MSDDYALTPKHLRDIAWALDSLTRLTECLLEPIAMGVDANAGEVTVKVNLTMKDEPLGRDDAVKLLDWVSGDDMQRGLREWADDLEREGGA